MVVFLGGVEALGTIWAFGEWISWSYKIAAHGFIVENEPVSSFQSQMVESNSGIFAGIDVDLHVARWSYWPVSAVINNASPGIVVGVVVWLS